MRFITRNLILLHDSANNAFRSKTLFKPAPNKRAGFRKFPELRQFSPRLTNGNKQVFITNFNINRIRINSVFNNKLSNPPFGRLSFKSTLQKPNDSKHCIVNCQRSKVRLQASFGKARPMHRLRDFGAAKPACSQVYVPYIALQNAPVPRCRTEL